MPRSSGIATDTAAAKAGRSGPATPGKPKKAMPKKVTTAKPADGAPRLLAGDNPQIAMGYGEAPVAAYLAAIPGWKQDIARRIDRLVTEAVPGVRKAVKWNSPFYGAAGEDGAWFLSFHCFAKYVKVAFFRGAALHPEPPGPSKQAEVRYLDLREEDAFDEAQVADWIGQASRLPGVRM